MTRLSSFAYEGRGKVMFWLLPVYLSVCLFTWGYSHPVLMGGGYSQPVLWVVSPSSPSGLNGVPNCPETREGYPQLEMGLPPPPPSSGTGLDVACIGYVTGFMRLAVSRRRTFLFKYTFLFQCGHKREYSVCIWKFSCVGIKKVWK